MIYRLQKQKHNVPKVLPQNFTRVLYLPLLLVASYTAASPATSFSFNGKFPLRSQKFLNYSSLLYDPLVWGLGDAGNRTRPNRNGLDMGLGRKAYTHACSPLPPSAVGIDCEKSATLGKQGETSSRRNISLYPNLIKGRVICICCALFHTAQRETGAAANRIYLRRPVQRHQLLRLPSFSHWVLAGTGVWHWPRWRSLCCIKNLLALGRLVPTINFQITIPRPLPSRRSTQAKWNLSIVTHVAQGKVWKWRWNNLLQKH